VNLRSLDLNLLVVLDALLEERHVTRAAARIGLSQPAMSNALSRLRAMFGDTLLLRTPHGMEPTPRAIALAGPVRQALRQVQRLLDAEEAFDPATCRQGFTLRMSDLLGRLLLPALMTRLRAEAPGVSLDIVHLPPTQTVDRLEADPMRPRRQHGAGPWQHHPDGARHGRPQWSA
jgi:DNA-binding transcriptional LysR family regulator